MASGRPRGEGTGISSVGATGLTQFPSSPQCERDLVTTAEESAGDLLRARPRTAHLRAGKHGDDKDFHVLRLRARRKSTQLLLIVFAPHAHGLEDGLQAAAQLSERVLDARRDLGENLTVNNARILHGA